MNRNRIVAGLDVHKDSVYLCIMGYNESVIFQKTYGVLTTELRQMRDDMLCHGVTECAIESTRRIYRFLCGECFRKDWSVISFCRKPYVCNGIFTFPTDDCNLCICHNSDVFLQLTLECQEGRTDRQIVVKCDQQSIIPIGTTFVYAILVL